MPTDALDDIPELDPTREACGVGLPRNSNYRHV
jgi:hypothetical protein